MSDKRKPLTTTSFALLGLLSRRPWSVYGLAQQMTRSLNLLWPRAISGIYEEPKNLVAHGLADVRHEPAGRRTRAVYTITAEGRDALREWLRRPSAPPEVEAEAVVRVLFGDETDKESLLAAVASVREHAQELQAMLVNNADEYATGHGPFQAHGHVAVLAGRFAHEYLAGMQRWADWATTEIESWSSTNGDEMSWRGAEIARANAIDFAPYVVDHIEPHRRQGEPGRRP